MQAHRRGSVRGLPLAGTQPTLHGTESKLPAEQRPMARQSLIRVPIGAYGSGGPYHSSSIESVLANIRGIKVAYPSNGADLKGLLKAAFYDPNPVVVLSTRAVLVQNSGHRIREGGGIDSNTAFRSARPAPNCTSTNPSARRKAPPPSSPTAVGYSPGGRRAFPGRWTTDLRCIQPVDYEAIEASVAKTNRCSWSRRSPWPTASPTPWRATSPRDVP